MDRIFGISYNKKRFTLLKSEKKENMYWLLMANGDKIGINKRKINLKLE